MKAYRILFSGVAALVTLVLGGCGGSTILNNHPSVPTKQSAAVYVAYSSYLSGEYSVNVINLNAPTTGSVQQASGTKPLLWPAISPDQSTIAYANGQMEIDAVPLGKGSPVAVHQWAANFTIEGLDWNPSGNGFVISYDDNARNTCGLATVSLDGSTVTPVTATTVTTSCDENTPGAPRYLTDGRIVYSTRTSIIVVSADGVSQTPINNGTGMIVSNPSPTYDQSQLLFVGSATATAVSDLYVMNMDGSGLMPIPGTSGVASAMQCSNGTIVVGTPNGNIGTIDGIDGANPTPLSTLGTFPYCR